MLEARIKPTEPMTVAFLVMHGSFDQIPQGFQRLYEAIGRYGLQPVGMPGALYLTMPGETGPGEAVFELWAPIAGGAGESEPDESGFGVKRIEAETVAAAVHKGSYDGVAETYKQLGDWIMSQGAQVIGPPREFYLTDPDEVPAEEYLTEIQFPVLPVGAHVPA